MNEKRLVRVSKYLSKHLRHRPERLNLQLEPGGWVEVDGLLEACKRHNFPLSRPELEEVVGRNDKRRFAFDESGTRIRAQQGHSIPIDLELEPVEPPSVLYHGTGGRVLETILENGLHKMGRHHVHLSPDVETAKKVGSRRGKPVVLEVAAGAMCREGWTFYLSGNGVWLVEQVPPRYLKTI